MALLWQRDGYIPEVLLLVMSDFLLWFDCDSNTWSKDDPPANLTTTHHQNQTNNQTPTSVTTTNIISNNNINDSRVCGIRTDYDQDQEGVSV